jgi:hypothetical protein
MTRHRRREALRAGALAVAGAALLPGVARAESDEGGLLLGLRSREMNAGFAYARVLHVDPLFAVLRGHAEDHAKALATQLAAVGLGTPSPPHEQRDLDVAAERVLAGAPDRAAVVAAALRLEQDLVEVYKTALPALPDADIAMTAATILASHAQLLLVLEEQSGLDSLATG